MASLALKLHMFQFLPPNNGGRPHKYDICFAHFLCVSCWILSAFAELQKATISFSYLSVPLFVRPSFHMKQFGSH